MELSKKNLKRVWAVIFLSVLATIVVVPREGLGTALALVCGLWLFSIGLATDSSVDQRDAATAERDRFRKFALDQLAELLKAADAFAEHSRFAELPDPNGWRAQNMRKRTARKFVFDAARLGITQQELAYLLDHDFFHLDPLVLRDEVDSITTGECWPEPTPLWKTDLMTFVRRHSRWLPEEVARFDASLDAYNRR